MNSKQASALRTFTNMVSDFIKDMAFDVTKMDDGSIMVFGSNTGRTEWYVKHEVVCAFVGPRGGVRVKDGNKFIRKWA